jgi:CoA:oxalate CoA-transferase
VSGFGQTGPETDRPAYDLIAQALSGWMSVTGNADGPPFKAGDSIGDLAAGLFAGWGIALALFNRARTGRGMVIDVAMFDSLLALLPTPFSQWICGVTPQRVGNRHPLSTPFGTFAAADGHFVICVLNQAQFERLARLIGRPEFASDPRFASDAARTAHEPDLRGAIEAWSTTLCVEDATALLQAEKIPTAPIWSVEQALGSAQAAARTLVTTADHPVLGRVKLPQQPVHFAGEARVGSGPAPALGADTAAVLRDILGHSAGKIAAMAAGGVIQCDAGQKGDPR